MACQLSVRLGIRTCFGRGERDKTTARCSCCLHAERTTLKAAEAAVGSARSEVAPGRHPAAGGMETPLRCAESVTCVTCLFFSSVSVTLSVTWYGLVGSRLVLGTLSFSIWIDGRRLFAVRPSVAKGFRGTCSLRVAGEPVLTSVTSPQKVRS